MIPMNKPSKPAEKARTHITEADDGATISALHRAWQRDMAKALGGVKTQNAAVEKMEAVRKVHAILSGEEKK
jgi:hypothetical protein